MAAELPPTIAGQVPASAWRCYAYRTRRKGPLQRRAVLVPVWRWEPSGQRAQALHLLISRELDGSQTKYSLCYTPAGSPPLSGAQALYRQMQRYWIERVFQEAKQMALHFLLATQLEGHASVPYLSFASLELLLAQKLDNLLHQERFCSPPCRNGLLI